MGVEVTARHMHDIGDIQGFAREKGEELVAEFARVEHVHIILDREKHRCKAEVVVQAKNHIRIEAEETSDNMRGSITSAVTRAEKQLRRLRDKILEHRPKGQKAAPAADEEGEV